MKFAKDGNLGLHLPDSSTVEFLSQWKHLLKLATVGFPLQAILAIPFPHYACMYTHREASTFKHMYSHPQHPTSHNTHTLTDNSNPQQYTAHSTQLASVHRSVASCTRSSFASLTYQSPPPRCHYCTIATLHDSAIIAMRR